MNSETGFGEACAGRPRQHAPIRRLGDVAQDFEEGALAGSIATNDANDFARFDLEAYVFERPELLDLVALDNLAPLEHVNCLPRKVVSLARDDVAQRIVSPLTGSVAKQVPLRQIFYGDDCIRHGCAMRSHRMSAKLFSIFLNRRMQNPRKKAVTPILIAKPGA